MRRALRGTAIWPSIPHRSGRMKRARTCGAAGADEIIAMEARPAADRERRGDGRSQVAARAPHRARSARRLIRTSRIPRPLGRRGPAEERGGGDPLADRGARIGSEIASGGNAAPARRGAGDRRAAAVASRNNRNRSFRLSRRTHCVQQAPARRRLARSGEGRRAVRPDAFADGAVSRYTSQASGRRRTTGRRRGARGDRRRGRQPSGVSGARAHSRWELGRGAGFDYDYPDSIAMYSQSAGLFHDIGDRPDEAFVETMMSVLFHGRTA